MQIIDLAGFDSFLAERALVPERQRPYYVMWVERYLGSPVATRDLRDADKRRYPLSASSEAGGTASEDAERGCGQSASVVLKSVLHRRRAGGVPAFSRLS